MVCDSTSAFHSIGKTKAWNALGKNEEDKATLVQLGKKAFPSLLASRVTVKRLFVICMQTHPSGAT